MPFFRFHESQSKPGSSEAPPLISSFLQGKVPCESCGERLNVRGYAPLCVLPCSKCGKNVMVPYELGDYVLYKMIGGGGMGLVFKATTQSVPFKEFAVKIVPPECAGDESLIAALDNEAKVAALFRDHPNIMTSVELNQHEGVHYFVSEFISGQRWDDRVFRYGRMSEEELIPMMLTLIEVERNIYQKGFLFRDLKPENIMITPPNRPIVIDFGLCMDVVEAMFETDNPMVNGAPHFMPPERLTGAGESVWSEIYSLGMLMYYSLTGQTFFESGEVQETAERYLASGREDMVFDNLDLHPDLARIVMRAIQSEPAKRYVSFESFETELKEYRLR